MGLFYDLKYVDWYYMLFLKHERSGMFDNVI
jgi:hypothetical protein